MADTTPIPPIPPEIEVKIHPPRQWRTNMAMWPPTIVLCKIEPRMVEQGATVVASLCDNIYQPVDDGRLIGTLMSPVKKVDDKYYAAFPNLIVTIEGGYKLYLQLNYFDYQSMGMATLCHAYTAGFSIYGLQVPVTLMVLSNRERELYNKLRNADRRKRWWGIPRIPNGTEL